MLDMISCHVVMRTIEKSMTFQLASSFAKKYWRCTASFSESSKMKKLVNTQSTTTNVKGSSSPMFCKATFCVWTVNNTLRRTILMHVDSKLPLSMRRASLPTRCGSLMHDHHSTTS